MAKQFTLGKNERLKSRKQIEQLFSNGQRFVVPSYRVFYSLQPSTTEIPDSLQAGFSASSRNFKTAVARNRVKRLTREAYRLQKNTLKEKLQQQKRKLNVFFIYTGKELPKYEEVFESIRQAIIRLDQIANKNF